jgi:hypothetical protein
LVGKDTLNLESLTDMLNSASRRGYPVVKLGMGTAQQLAQVQKTYEKFNVSGGSVDAAYMDNFYRNPMIQQYLKTGQAFPAGVAEEVAAKTAFTRRVDEDIIKRSLGLKTDISYAEVAKRKEILKFANLDVKQQAAIVAQRETDPMFSVFKNVTLGLPNKLGENSIGLTKSLMNMGPAKSNEIMRTLRANKPEIAQAVEDRVVADMFAFISPNNTTPGQTWKVDGDKVKQFFNPALKGVESNPLNMAKAILSPETFGRFENTVKGFNQISDYLKHGKGTSTLSDAEMAAGLATVLGQGRITGSTMVARGYDRFLNLISNQHYHTVSKIITNPEFANAFYRTGGNVNMAIKSLPPQSAALMLKNELFKNELQDKQQ